MKDLGRLADSIDGLVKGLAQSQDQASLLELHLRTLLECVRVRENSHRVIEHDTGNVVERHHKPGDFFGVKASSMNVVGVGGGSLEVSINGSRFLAVTAGTIFENEAIEDIGIRVTAAVAGTAFLRVGAFVPPPMDLRLRGKRAGIGWPREVV